MKKILSILSITIGGLFLMLVIAMVIFGVDGPSDTTQTTNSTTTPQQSTETASRSSVDDQGSTETTSTGDWRDVDADQPSAQIPASENASRKNLQEAYDQLELAEQRLEDVRADGFQLTMDQYRNIYDQTNSIEVTIDRNDLTDEGITQVIEQGYDSQAIGAMSRAMQNLYEIIDGKSINGDEEANFDGNMIEFNSGLANIEPLLSNDDLWN